jgi:hypothetical protein
VRVNPDSSSTVLTLNLACVTQGTVSIWATVERDFQRPTINLSGNGQPDIVCTTDVGESWCTAAVAAHTNTRTELGTRERRLRAAFSFSDGGREARRVSHLSHLSRSGPADTPLGSLGCAWGDRVSQVRAFAGRRNRLAEFDSFFKADRPKFIARHAVSLDRIATVEQSQQVRDRKRVLWLFAPAARACRYEDNGLSHGENLFLICAVEPIGQSVNGG